MRTVTLLARGIMSLTLVVPVPLRAQADSTGEAIDSVKVEAIHRFLDLTRTADMFILGFEQAMEEQAESPDMPDGFLEAFRAKVHERTHEFIDMLVPLYDKHLSLDDVTTLNDFLGTPVGRRLVNLQVDLMTETAALAERWGMTLVGEVFMELARKPQMR